MTAQESGTEAAMVLMFAMIFAKDKSFNLDALSHLGDMLMLPDSESSEASPEDAEAVMAAAKGVLASVETMAKFLRAGPGSAGQAASGGPAEPPRQ